MKEFYISHVGDSITDLGIEMSHAISVTAKSHNGKEWALRLIPGYDPYMSLLIVRNGLLGVYRFDRRMAAMSDRSEIIGIDHEAVIEIATELCRNLLSKESDVVFLKQFVGEIVFPKTVVSIGSSPVYAGNQLVFTLAKQRFSSSLVVGLGKIPVMRLQDLKKTITGIEPTFALRFAKKVRKAYGRGVNVNYKDCIIKQ